jgi:hypothetical protein
MLLLAGGCAAPPGQGTAGTAPRPAHDQGRLIDEWGVEITGVRISAAGYIVDFRYRVHDAEKSVPLFVRKTKPVLTQEKTGLEIPLYRSPKVGPMRSSYTPKEGRVYTILFSNSNRTVKPGDRVTVRIGDFVVRNLVVE